MDTAQHIVIQVAHGDFAAVEQRLAGYIKPLLSVEALRASWQGIEQQVGAFQELGKTSIVQTQQGLVHVVTCIFERASLDVNVVLNDAGEIIGLTITPVGTIEQQANATYEPPSYAQPTPSRSRKRSLMMRWKRWPSCASDQRSMRSKSLCWDIAWAATWLHASARPTRRFVV